MSAEDIMSDSKTISSAVHAIHLRSETDEIRNDRTSGASQQTRRAAKLLVECAEYAPEDLAEIAGALIAAQPATGPIYNLATLAVRSRDVPGACREFLESMDRSIARVAQIAAALVPDGATVMTHSFSSTILSALREAWWGGKRFSVICPESRPMCEGVAMAASLGVAGIPVSLVADCAIHRALPGVRLVLVGADAASPRGIFNKTGTALLALAARELGVPVYALCSSCKFLPRFYDPPPEIPSDPRELLERELPHITVLNYHFDVTPLDYVSGIVTEEGVLTPAELREKLLGLNAPPEPALAGPVKPGGTALAAPQPERGPQFGFSC
jgi:translation initiation factor 2B subunit (eIF-2B alpha/beta/delta family)